MRLLFSLFLTLQFSLTSFSQDKQVLKGKVTDENSAPLEFVNAILLNFKDSSLVKGAITDAGGAYIFEDVDAGNYLVMVNQLGYSRVYTPAIAIGENTGSREIPPITLKENVVQLKEANVVALKPFIERRIDKTIVNVENSIVDAGSNVLEILQRSPGVIVDNEGNISLKGKQGVLVLIDDKQTYLSASDLQNMLRNMTSDQLSSIEIITNPSSRYDAAGNSGILNIKLRKKQNIGLNGSATLSYGQGRYPDFGGGTNLNYRNESFNLFGNYNYMYGYYFQDVELNRNFKEQDHTSRFLQTTFDKGRYINHNYRLGADYFIGSRQTIGLQASGYNSMNKDRTTSRTEVFNYTSVADSSYVTQNHNDSKWENFSANLNYRFNIDSTGRALSTDLDYGRYDNKSDFRFETVYYFPDGSKPGYRENATNDQPASIDIRTFKIDYVHPFSKSFKIESGVKSSFVKTDSDVRYYNLINDAYLLDTGKSNHFIYKENINAAYLSGAVEFGKFGIQAGLRAEQTIADGDQRTTGTTFHRDVLQFFPTLFLSYEFSPNHESKISYSRRIDRPGYQQLNPFRYFLDPYNYNEGNPDLQPQLTNSVEISHTFMKIFTLAVNYRHTDDAMTEISKQIDSTRTTFVRTENLESNDNYGISLGVPVQLTKWWYMSSNFNYFNNRYKGISSVGEVDKRLNSYQFNTYNAFTLPRSWAMEVNGYYTSRMVWGTFLIDPRFSVSAGLRKHFMQDRFTLRVNINDIFHTETFNSVINYQNVDAKFMRVYDSQFVRFHLSYNFGKKTVPKARQRATGLQEEESRIRTGR